MEITFIGWISLLITVFLIKFKDIKYYLYAAIFFSGFTGASVLNIFGASLQPAYYFFIVYLLGCIFCGNKFRIRIDTSLLLFFCYSVFSIILPLFYQDQNITIMDQRGAYSLLRFSSSNIIHIGYLLFVLLFLNCLLKYTTNSMVIDKMIVAFRLGFFAVLLICLYQIIAFKYNLPFDSLFRQGVHGNVQGVRLYGPCDEASMLCCYLIPSMILVWQKRRRAVDYIAILVAVYIGFKTQSSTFLIGFCLCVILLIPNIIRTTINGLKITQIIFSCFLCGMIIVVILINKESLTDSLNAFIGKLRQESESGMERFSSMGDMIKVGLTIPTGVGFGSCRSKDLFSTWLCNTGIIGMSFFIAHFINLVRRSNRSRTVSHILPYAVTLILLFTSVPEPYFMFIWFFAFYSQVCSKENNSKKSISLKSQSI